MNQIIEKDQLYKAIWKSANSWRGTIEGWDMRNYVLITLFYRYVSENLTNYFNQEEWKNGNENFDYALLKDSDVEDSIKQACINEKGFFLYPSQLFNNVYQYGLSNEEDFNIKVIQVINDLENSNRYFNDDEDIVGLFEDYNLESNKLGKTTKERNKTLLMIFREIASWPLVSYSDNQIDVFGDAYEFLISTYAANAGKSGGEFFTPQEVSQLLTKIGLVDKKQINSVYDPACGSGSLLLQAIKVLGKDNVNQLYGQEINLSTYNLCRMNMWLHNISFNQFHIKHGDTLIDPQFDYEDKKYKFDLIVSNPPYSIKWIGSDDPLLAQDPRFSPAGVLAPKSKADWAFIMHSLAHLNNLGTAVFVTFPGILYRSGAEAKIREYLINNNLIDAVIQMPENLFFGTSIATCILVIKKSKNNTNVCFIDASKEFIKVTNDNKLTNDNINNILKMYADRKNVDNLVKIVSIEEIAQKNFNLSVNTYVEKEDTREKIDIKLLNQELKEIVARQEILRKEIDKIIAELEGE
ncbi:type I restriction-modification system subunit M [Mycoplasma sp. 1018B]|uniref:type I restriction-modification system subunit M n=1 Tax=Mycoplasma sp. 1018B TaxID=2967302 RepID=UPI00211BE22A|nr:type I restriction-modification system subunit M [Mycoplasma sp. 1018B]UUM19431.1 type I restriction-modification system subunit M [Mycoplasma sp. 1018B]